MRPGRKILIAGTFSFFQFAMPVIGWVCVRTVAQQFRSFQKWIPWIAMVLLLWLGIKMIREGIARERTAGMIPEGTAPERASGMVPEGTASERAADAPAHSRPEINMPGLGPGMLFVQGIATSIDALSTGFAFAAYTPRQIGISALIIAVETFAICMGGLEIGSRFGKEDSGRPSIAGGAILILIACRILLEH